MRRIFGAVLVLSMIVSMTGIASAETGSVEVRGHIVGIDEPVEQYHITYHANGGRGGYNGPDVASGSADTVCSPARTGITRSGHRFTGWNTRQDGSGIAYMAGDRIVLNRDVALYAQWRRITESGGGGTRLPGGEWTPWSGGTTTTNDGATAIGDGAVPAGDRVTIPSGDTPSFNPYTGAGNNVPLCIGLLCASLGVIVFLLWADRRN